MCVCVCVCVCDLLKSLGIDYFETILKYKH